MRFLIHRYRCLPCDLSGVATEFRRASDRPLLTPPPCPCCSDDMAVACERCESPMTWREAEDLTPAALFGASMFVGFPILGAVVGGWHGCLAGAVFVNTCLVARHLWNRHVAKGASTLHVP